jgi:hypothetical protein
MNEPVITREDLRDKVWEEISENHPKWVKRGMLIVPDSAWQYSLKGCNSVRSKMTIPYSLIKIIE